MLGRDSSIGCATGIVRPRRAACSVTPHSAGLIPALPCHSQGSCRPLPVAEREHAPKIGTRPISALASSRVPTVRWPILPAFVTRSSRSTGLRTVQGLVASRSR